MRNSQPPQPKEKPPSHNSWMHLAAMNLVADHAAGKPVGVTKLELARRLLGQPYAPERIAAEEA